MNFEHTVPKTVPDISFQHCLDQFQFECFNWLEVVYVAMSIFMFITRNTIRNFKKTSRKVLLCFKTFQSGASDCHNNWTEPFVTFYGVKTTELCSF